MLLSVPMVELECGCNMEFKESTEFLGLNTLRRANEIGRHSAAHTLNADLSSSSQIAPLKAYSVFGKQYNATDKIVKQDEYERGLGHKSLLQVRDDGSNTILELLIEGDNRNSEKGEFVQLIDDFTTGKILSLAPFNDTGTDNLLMSNGADNFSRWNGAVCILDGAVSAAEGTLTVQKMSKQVKTNPTDGFDSSGDLIVNDDSGNRVVIAYTGKTDTTFTGCTNTPAMSDKAGIAQAVDTSTYSARKKFTFILTAQGRLFGTGVDSSPTTLYSSTVGDFTDIGDAAGSTPDAEIIEDFPEGGRNYALASIDKTIVIYKESQVWGLTFVYPSSTTRVAQRSKLSDTGIAPSIKAIDRVDADYIHISPEGLLMRLSHIASEDLFNSEDLLEDIRPTIEDWVWDDAEVKYWKKKRTLIISGKTDSTQDNNNKAVIIQFSKDKKKRRIANIGILDWFIGAMAVYNQQLYFGGSVESECYKAFDGYSKNGAGYRFEYTTNIKNYGSEFKRKTIQGIALKGRIGAGTTLFMDILLDEFGKTAKYTRTIKQSDSDYVTQSPDNPLGVNALGSEILGGTKGDVSELDDFLVFYPLPIQAKPFNIQLNFYTDGEGQNVALFAYGIAVVDAKTIDYPKKED